MFMQLTCSLTVSLVALALHFMSPLLSKHYSAKCIYITWMIIIISLVIPIRPIFDYRIHASIHPSSITQDKLLTLSNYGAITGENTMRVFNTNSYWITAVWILGVIATMTITIVRHIHFNKRIGLQMHKANNISYEILSQVSSELGITKKIRIYACHLTNKPLLIGLLNPIILLPISDFSNKELALIFKHELYHYKRRDLWHMLLILLATALHWFNPCIYFFARLARLQCEISCNEALMRGVNKEMRLHYSNTIMALYLKRNKYNTFLTTDLFEIDSLPKRRNSIILYRDIRDRVSIVFIAILCIVISGTAFAGYINPSAQYYEKKWETNTNWNQRIFKIEPETDTYMPTNNPAFMGVVNITYNFNSDTLGNTVCNQLQWSTYDIIVMKAIDLGNKLEVDAFVNYLLLTEIQRLMDNGILDTMPKQPEYSYIVELPENLQNYRIQDFFKELEIELPPETGYEVSYKINGRVITAYIPPANISMPPQYTESIEEQAKRVIERAAKQIRIELPDNFQDDLQIVPILR